MKKNFLKPIGMLRAHGTAREWIGEAIFIAVLAVLIVLALVL